MCRSRHYLIIDREPEDRTVARGGRSAVNRQVAENRAPQMAKLPRFAAAIVAQATRMRGAEVEQGALAGLERVPLRPADHRAFTFKQMDFDPAYLRSGLLDFREGCVATLAAAGDSETILGNAVPIEVVCHCLSAGCSERTCAAVASGRRLACLLRGASRGDASNQHFGFLQVVVPQ